MTTIETSANSNTIFLLTGAAGFLGSNITRTLISKGKKVRVLVLPDDPAASQVPAEAEVTLGNLLDNNSLEEFFTVPKGTDIIVIHCASMVTVSAELTQKLYDINSLDGDVFKTIVPLSLSPRKWAITKYRAIIWAIKQAITLIAKRYWLIFPNRRS